jgi:4-hydroxybenzoate polyprenyltransferase
MTGSLSPVVIPLYVSGIAWTLFYDTIYALQDIRDDVKTGVKSTAVWLGEDRVKGFLVGITGVFTIGAGITGLVNELGVFYWVVGVGASSAHMAWITWKLNTKDEKGAGLAFRKCVWTGVLLFLGIFGDLIVNLWSEEEEAPEEEAVR